MSTSGGGRAAARGTLEERPVGRLLYQVFAKRLTGRVVITVAGGETSELFLREGSIVHARRRGDADPPAGMDAAGEIRRKLLQLVAVREGTFEVFVETHSYGQGANLAMMRVDPRVILYPAIRASHDHARLEAELAPLATFSFRLAGAASDLLEMMEMPGNHPTVQALHAGRVTLGELAGLGGPGDGRAIILALLYADLLDTRPLAQPPVAPPLAPTAVPAPVAPDPGVGAAITALAAKVDGLSAFELLGVSETATAAEVNAAYLRAARQYHPDRLAGAGLRDLVPTAEKIMARITEASATLSDPVKRAEYQATRSGKKAAEGGNAILAAERIFQRGESALKKGDHARALEAFTEAARMNAAEPQYGAYLAFVRWSDPRASKTMLATETLKILEAMVRAQPTFAIGHYWIGQIRNALGETDRAERAFRDALALDDNMFDAQRELRLLTMRKKAGASGGVLGKLFKK